jgi:hypothetical protein
MSKIFIFSGHFGGGKSVTAYSFVPPNHKPKTAVHRLVLDHEIRYDTYKSPDDQDHPEKLQYAFTPLGKGRITPEDVEKMFELVHTKKYTNKPDVIILDDVAMTQGRMGEWWKVKENAMKTATLYGVQAERCLTAKTWKPQDPGTVNFFKTLFVEFMLDCKDQDITLILTSPQHNIWQDYGKPGYDPIDKLPLMRIIGKSAKVWDCWQQMADVIWVFDRHDKDGKLVNMPKVEMDVLIPKASLPGVPESFEWPGWETVWKWHDERKFVADVNKLKKPEPGFDAETTEKMIKQGKSKLIAELKTLATLKQIGDAMASDLAPDYTLEDHEKVKEFILRWIMENPPTGAPAGSQPIKEATDGQPPEDPPQ